MKELLRTTDLTIIAYASALLQGEGIDCFPIDVHMSVLEGSVGVLPRRMMVREKDHYLAEKILLENDIDLGR
ncbi:MAG: putative signal transducing protein [Paracoccaceae bacterium]